MKTFRLVFCSWFLVLVFFAAIPAGIYFYGKYLRTDTAKETILLNWDIRIPDAFEEVYHHSTPSFHGDGERYTVYDYEVAPSGFLDLFRGTPNSEIEDFLYSVTDNLEVPADYRPDLSSDYDWMRNTQYGTNTIVILHLSESQRFYIAQYFS